MKANFVCPVETHRLAEVVKTEPILGFETVLNGRLE